MVLSAALQVVDCGNVAWYNRKEYSWAQIEAVRRELEQLGHRTLLVASSHSVSRYHEIALMSHILIRLSAQLYVSIMSLNDCCM